MPQVGDSYGNGAVDTIKTALVRLAESIQEPLEKILVEALIVLMDFYKPGFVVGESI